MWRRKPQLTDAQVAANIRLVIPEAALLTVFDECDNFTEDETGGRVIGTFSATGSKLTITVTGIIEPGPAARRSRVSFFQDGPYQEGIFRQVEQRHPETEHLGNWHTHHVNGLPHLSQGDVSTYTRTVNHPKHNIPFFYALLVIAKNEGATGLGRYEVRHYVFRRDDPTYYEIPAKNVKIVDAALVWPAPTEPVAGERNERVIDRDILAELYSGFRSFSSDKLGFYWRGELILADGLGQDVIVLEGEEKGYPCYRVAVRGATGALESAAHALEERDFPSARVALVTAERALNAARFAVMEQIAEEER